MTALPSARQVVIDSSALVALLTDAGPVGDWVERTVASTSLAAPDLALVEGANILRRQALAGHLTAEAASLAHADLLALPIELWPHGTLADRTWALRGNLTCYDASYVALAELLDAPLVTLDVRLTRAPGPLCTVQAYGG